MSVIRQLNFLGQMRLDVPHFKMWESSIVADFDLLAGRIIGGQKPLVVSGFKMVTTNAVGSAAASLQLVTAGGMLLHYQASENGSLFVVPADRAAETLNSTNARVKGAFTASKVNYVGIDLRRSADTTTSDVVMFIDPTTKLEQPRTVPLGRVLDYVIVISTTDFTATPNILPIARVQTDANNNVVALDDARNLLGRLGAGGAVPDRFSSYGWPGGRAENTSGNVFTGGDKNIGSLKDWMDAIMSRLWEVGGGEYWYSSTADRNVNMAGTGATFTTTNEFFEWVSDNLHWKGLKFTFADSTGWYNNVANQETDEAGLTDLADGECIYVDIDRTQNLSGGDALQPVKAELTSVGSPEVPGSRFVMAVRIGDYIWTRNSPLPVGSYSALVPLDPAPGDPAGTWYRIADVKVDDRGRVIEAEDQSDLIKDIKGTTLYTDAVPQNAESVTMNLYQISLALLDKRVGGTITGTTDDLGLNLVPGTTPSDPGLLASPRRKLLGYYRSGGSAKYEGLVEKVYPNANSGSTWTLSWLSKKDATEDAALSWVFDPTGLSTIVKPAGSWTAQLGTDAAPWAKGFVSDVDDYDTAVTNKLFVEKRKVVTFTCAISGTSTAANGGVRADYTGIAALRNAIDAANALGGSALVRIVLREGNYDGSVAKNITVPMEIVGIGPHVQITSMPGGLPADAFLNIQANGVVLKNLEFVSDDVAGGNNGAVKVNGTYTNLLIEDCLFTDCAVYLAGGCSDITFNRCQATITDNATGQSILVGVSTSGTKTASRVKVDQCTFTSISGTESIATSTPGGGEESSVESWWVENSTFSYGFFVLTVGSEALRVMFRNVTGYNSPVFASDGLSATGGNVLIQDLSLIDVKIGHTYGPSVFFASKVRISGLTVYGTGDSPYPVLQLCSCANLVAENVRLQNITRSTIANKCMVDLRASSSWGRSSNVTLRDWTIEFDSSAGNVWDQVIRVGNRHDKLRLQNIFIESNDATAGTWGIDVSDLSGGVESLNGVITGCRISGMTDGGIRLNCSDFTISDTEIVGSGVNDAGITLNGYRNRVRGCRIRNCYGLGVDAESILSGGRGVSHDFTWFNDNHIHDNNGGATSDQVSVYVSGGTSYFFFLGNVLKGGGGSGTGSLKLWYDTAPTPDQYQNGLPGETSYGLETTGPDSLVAFNICILNPTA